MIDYNVIIAAILGSAGVFGLIQFLISRHDRKLDDLNGIKKELGLMRNTLKDTNVRVTRMELLGLIKNDPDNVDAILQVAECYFVELDGNAYAHAIFEKWATDHNVPYGWLPKIAKRTDQAINKAEKEKENTL